MDIFSSFLFFKEEGVGMGGGSTCLLDPNSKARRSKHPCTQLSIQPEVAKNLFEVLLVSNQVHTASTES